ncbi:MULTISPECIES: hypothetical protein [Leptospira]|uniref:Uncharacterized protein n=6 Tax=Leptospira santarosai TaxID=28183 RepID=A0AB73LMF3_9LEPT|nr:MULTISPECIES: hypothetical protein [Leptospira]EMO56185.1 hypothetical protein LEP1GSC161_2093 [Leptospira santarosai str. CBC1416]AIT10847.1 hypothetical protein LSS_21195 [Leptospira santarosai serovar Shermani str. LT 821]ASV12301.1 hypothetical protein B2G51_12060 [Leptospira santarosai]EKO35074.1 hypothetical protein LEP1GSC179_2317 [Leptospira santarosai str. MOR084]EKO77312.1 hypothetical protein LEP1GSC068_3698 [Leptospira sp. Fiocruz LV3954]
MVSRALYKNGFRDFDFWIRFLLNERNGLKTFDFFASKGASFRAGSKMSRLKKQFPKMLYWNEPTEFT